MKILIIDDHPLIREALRHVLAELDEGIVLMEARSCAEALTVTDENPDLALLLLDLGLPDVDGFEALGMLRERHSAIPVVVLSASEQPEVVMRAIDAGAMGFIPKTSSTHLLLSALRFVLAGGVYLPVEILRQRKQGPANAPALADTGKLSATVSPRDLGLTSRQAQVLSLVLQGKPNKLICRELDVAEGTVKIHVAAILRALGVDNRTQAVIEVGRLGMKLDALGAAGHRNAAAGNPGSG